jgi:cytochrome bd-type quinol oxidase subunit 2
MAEIQKKEFYTKAKWITFILFLLLIAWGIVSPISIAEISGFKTRKEFIQFLSDTTLLYQLNYVLATLMTFFSVAMFSALYLESRQEMPLESHIGILFVPMYAITNIIVYGSQISIVPEIIKNLELSNNMILDHWVFQMLQSVHGSIFNIVNSFAYAVLGIPCICFAIALFKKNMMGKIAAVLLTLTTIASSIGFIGANIYSDTLIEGIRISSLIFIFAVLFIFLHYVETERKLKHAKDNEPLQTVQFEEN